MPKDDDKIPPGLPAEQTEALDKIGPSREQLEAIKKHLALTPGQREAVQRIGRQQADLRRRLSPEALALRADLAHARRQAAEWLGRVRLLEAKLSEITGPEITGPAPPPPAAAAPVATPPTAPSRRPKEERPIDHARRAVQALWPEGDPGPDKLLLKTAVEDVNAWLADEARLGGRPPSRPISPDTVSRAVARRK